MRRPAHLKNHTAYGGLTDGEQGFVNECPERLHEKTRPVTTPDFPERYLALFPGRKNAFMELRRNMKALGLDETVVFEAMAAELKKLGTQI